MSKRSRKLWIFALIALMALALLAHLLGGELAHGLRQLHGQP